MNNKEEILKFIKAKIRSGYPAGELKNELLEKGYSSEEIKELLYEISRPPHIKNPGIENSFNNSNSVITLAGISLLILGVAIVSAEFWYTTVGYLSIIVGVLLLLPKLLKLVGNEFKRK
jgi:hypothetical protein